MAKSYLTYNKSQLINLNYSLNKELLRTSRNGGYSSSTIIGCNTRKYHGLLVAPQELIDGERHVLLSNVDETLIINDSEFHLSSRIYPGGKIFPKGHKYLREFESDPNMKLTYRIGKTIFHKEYIFVKNESRLLLRYSVEDTLVDELTFRIAPFLAYRNIHSLAKSNLWVNNKYIPIENGASWQMYEGYSKLFFQVSKESEYVHSPDWHYDIEYPKERERGYECNEDLFVPGFFDIRLKKNESIVISIGLEEKNPGGFKRSFTNEINKRFVRNNYENCLKNAGEEFIIRSKGRTDLIAGFHWYGRRGRDTFVALPGITLTTGHEAEFHAILRSMIQDLNHGMFPDYGSRERSVYQSPDTVFWFFRALHKYADMTGDTQEIWPRYGKVIQEILQSIREEKQDLIRLHDNGLMWLGQHGQVCSWMNAIYNGMPVVPRKGYLVEVNAIWYDALCFFIDLARQEKDKGFLKIWEKYPEMIAQSFRSTFWDEKKAYLADFVDEKGQDWDIRPNMIFAVSERYSPLKDYQKEYVLKEVKSELLTRRGLRTLSPNDNNYRGKYEGNQSQRDKAYHQGTVWPWLLGAFAESYLKLHQKTGKGYVEKIYLEFENEMKNKGVGTISEVYDGNPPHESRGAISQAWSVAELLRIKWMLDNRDKY